MSAGSVLLVAMPWETLPKPSIQLGTLQAVLERAGIPTAVRSMKLAFMEHCRAATAGGPAAERIEPSDYEAVAAEHFGVGLGDWIFAVPPFREGPDPDTAYLHYAREQGVPEPALVKAQAMRRLVPAFVEACVADILGAGPRVVGFTSAFSQNVASLVLSRRLKEADPTLRVVFGGANCEGPMGAALHRSFPWVDVVVRGEAERVLPELVRNLVAGGPVRPQPGLCYRDGEQAVAVDPAGEATVPMEVRGRSKP